MSDDRTPKDVVLDVEDSARKPLGTGTKSVLVAFVEELDKRYDD